MLFEQTQEDSLTDPLTGLPNTRFLFMHLTRELARAERLKSELSLMVMDLDHFKEINDSHGHHVGDRALCEVARVLRAGDPSVRHLRPLRRRRVHRRAVGMRRGRGRAASARNCSRASTRCTSRRGPARPLRLGISVGTAVFPQDGESYESLAGDRRQPHVSGQGHAQTPVGSRPAAVARHRRIRRHAPRPHRRRHPARRVRHPP